jgi:hypothetical protein
MAAFNGNEMVHKTKMSVVVEIPCPNAITRLAQAKATKNGNLYTGNTNRSTANKLLEIITLASNQESSVEWTKKTIQVRVM